MTADIAIIVCAGEDRAWAETAVRHHAEGRADVIVATAFTEAEELPGADETVNLPGADGRALVDAALARVETPFVVLSAPGDLLVDSALESAVHFLAAHEDHAAAIGEVFGWRPSDDGPRLRPLGVLPPPPRAPGHAATTRLLQAFGTIAPPRPLVLRTTVLRHAFWCHLARQRTRLADGLVQHLVTAIAAIEGKIASLPCFFGAVRLDAPHRRPLIEEALATEGREDQVQALLEMMTIHLMVRAGSSTEEAKSVLARSLAAYLHEWLPHLDREAALSPSEVMAHARLRPGLPASADTADFEDLVHALSPYARRLAAEAPALASS